MRRIHAAAISNPPPEFLEHLHRVNPPLTAALQWINPASCRSTPLTCFSEQQGAGSKAHDYVRGMAGNATLSDRGITAFAGELAAFEWIQAGCPDRELRAFALANGVSTNHVRFYARQVFEILQAGVPFAPEWQRQAVA